MAYYYYETEQLTDRSMSIYANAVCVGYGTGESHQRIIEGAGGEIGYDGFKNPMPNQSGKIYASRVFINQNNNEIQGINFVDNNGAFVCSYMGTDYEDIKNSNERDIETKTKEMNSSIKDSVQSGDEAFFESVDRSYEETMSHEDAEFFKMEETVQASGVQTGEDRAFFEEVEGQAYQFEEETEQNTEDEMQSQEEPSQGQKGIKR